MARRRLKHPIRVSSLSFHKGSWTRREAIGWLKEHDYGRFRASDFTSSKNYWGIRVIDVAPNTCNYRRQHWGNSGILATYCVPKARAPKVQALDFGSIARRIRTRRVA